MVNADRQDAAEALEHLAEALKSPMNSKIPGNLLARPGRPDIPHGELTPLNVCLTLAALQPENAVIVDEGLTTSTPYYDVATGLPRHSFLTTVGGAIGYGIPCAVGAAIACPERPVIAFQADGSAMYTVQALWTMAHEALNVTTLICANRSYHILKVELSHAGVTSAGPQVSSLVELDRPDISWVKLAQGMGVPAVSVNNVAGLARELRGALSEPGPHLIEMMIVPPAL
jgi:acetolactate synthase-1/2/3 large subunit